MWSCVSQGMELRMTVLTRVTEAELWQSNIIMSLTGCGTENDCADKGHRGRTVTVKCGHESHRVWNWEWLCWQGSQRQNCEWVPVTVTLSWGGSISKHAKILEKAEIWSRVPQETWNHEQIYWWWPTAIYTRSTRTASAPLHLPNLMLPASRNCLVAGASWLATCGLSHCWTLSPSDVVPVLNKVNIFSSAYREVQWFLVAKARPC
jgi:hypothetical protein